VVAAGYVGGQAAARRNAHAGAASAPASRSPRGESSSLTPEERAAFIPGWDELQRRVRTEPTDPEWSPQTEATIQRIVTAQLAPEVSIKQLHCASSLCRAELQHPASPRIPYVKFVTFTLNRESLGSMELQLDTRDEGVTALYFLRSKAFAAP
jgi:hypothetical protein